ncbi:MAG: Ig-like domain-containing protein [Candidatus Microgenomates bacterium]|jgi:hypothetical protein
MIKRSKIPTILGIVVLLVGTFAGVFFLGRNQVFRIGANPTSTPKDVRVSNLSDISATVSWTTGGQTSDFLNWGTTQNVGSIENESQTNEKFFNHSITLSGLKASTTYFYKINSEGTTFDNNGVPWQFTTGSTLAANQNSMPISGSVITASSQPSARAIVYVTVNGYLLSTLTSDSGSFVIQLAQVRTSDLTSYAVVDPATTLLEISVEAEDGETSSAQIFPQSANPIPTLILGQTQDYRSLQPQQSGQNPSANLNLPATATQESKINIGTTSATPAPTSVILESLTEGETVTSNQPQFFGKGPGGETITVTVHSQDVVSGTVKIPTNGSWSWSPPSTLSAGSHSITISWIDTSGITRTLTRDFIVQAGEAPAFVASPSGTPISTSTISPSPVPTLVPVSTATPTAIPTEISSPTAEPVPVTGDLTPTFLLSIMGLAILAFSVFVWRFSEK